MYLNSRVPSLNASDCVRLDRAREQSGNETETTTKWNQEVKKKSREKLTLSGQMEKFLTQRVVRPLGLIFQLTLFRAQTSQVGVG